jgi:hypothetical protein
VKEDAILFSKDSFPGKFSRTEIILTTGTKRKIVIPSLK